MNASESRVMAAVVDALNLLWREHENYHYEGCPADESGDEDGCMCFHGHVNKTVADALAQVAALRREGEPAEPMMLAPVSMLREYQDMLASCDGDTEAIDALFGESSDEEE
jgi:hypothetical protein